MSVPLHLAPLPPGYPVECEDLVTLPDGVAVFIRPLVPGDAEELGFALSEADPETLYLRFFRSSIRIDEELLSYLTVLDYRYRFALAAFAPDGRGIGVARYEGNPASDTAEMAVAVRPEWQRRGVGTALLTRLADAAAERGMRQLRADFLATNVGARRLLDAAGVPPAIYDSGIGSVVYELAPHPHS